MSDLTKKIATLGDPSFIPLGSSGDHVNYAPQTVRHILKGWRRWGVYAPTPTYPEAKVVPTGVWVCAGACHVWEPVHKGSGNLSKQRVILGGIHSCAWHRACPPLPGWPFLNRCITVFLTPKRFKNFPWWPTERNVSEFLYSELHRMMKY